MRKLTHRFPMVLVALVVLLCAVRISADDNKAQPRARPREQKSTERRERNPPAQAQPRERDRSRDQSAREEAQRRRPRPDEQYRRSHENRDLQRYDWRSFDRRSRSSRDRFPRYYFGPRLFDGPRYRGEFFGPHYGLWYRDRDAWRMFFWPYSYGPLRGCGWYFVPTDRRLFVDPSDGGEYWEYTEYRRLYVCFD